MYDFFLFLLHYLYSQPDTRTSCITTYLLSNITLYFPVLKEQEVSQVMCCMVVKNLLECLKHKILFVFEVHVYLHES